VEDEKGRFTLRGRSGNLLMKRGFPPVDRPELVGKSPGGSGEEKGLRQKDVWGNIPIRQIRSLDGRSREAVGTD